MQNIRFKCKCCNQYHEMIKSVPNGFSGWSYSNMEWSDFKKEVPPLTEKNWIRSDRVPKIDEFRIIKVELPFDEHIGNVFYMEFIPVSAFLNGFENAEQIRDSAIVQCRFEEIILSNEYCAWIKVKILNVILFTELPKLYPPYLTNCELEEYAGINQCIETDFIDTSLEIKSWSGQSDIGESKLIYIDTSDVRHLILMNFYDPYSNITYFGNIVQIK